MINTDFVENEIEILDRISGSRIKELATRLARIEMRVPGSPAEARTGEIIADEMRKLDLPVSIEEFDAISWEHGPARLVLSGDSNVSFDAQFMPFSPPVPKKGSKARLVPLRFGFPREYEGMGDSPAIVLADWNDDAGSLFQMIAAARSGRDIVGLILVSFHDRAYRVDAVPMITKPIPFPVISMTKEDGEKVRELCCEKEIFAKIEGESKIIPGAKSANIIGRKKGTDGSSLRIIVSAHHDGWFAGANDNLSSVASIIEVARALSDLSLARGIDFISFGCEEGGTSGYQYWLWGSRQYLKMHSKELKYITGVLNTELSGATKCENMVVDCTPDMVSFFEMLFELISERPAAREKNTKLNVVTPTSPQADQMIFSLAGVPSSLFYWAWYDMYHSELDAPELLEERRLQLFSEAVLLATLRYSHLPVLPLSLTRYARIIRQGHSGIRTQLTEHLRSVNTPGIDQLKKISGKSLEFGELYSVLDSLAISAAGFEKYISEAAEGIFPDINQKLVETCVKLNAGLCRTGGVMGEESLFPGFLAYSYQLKQLEEAIEALQRIDGTDISPDIMVEMPPILEPEIDISDFDLWDELRHLTIRRHRLMASLQGEISRIAGVIRKADEILRA